MKIELWKTCIWHLELHSIPILNNFSEEIKVDINHCDFQVVGNSVLTLASVSKPVFSDDYEVMHGSEIHSKCKRDIFLKILKYFKKRSKRSFNVTESGTFMDMVSESTLQHSSRKMPQIL